MENIIERIAHFSDIDTRRAMGIPPRRLPPSDLNLKMDFVRMGICKKFELNGASLSVTPDGGIIWVFGGPRLAKITEWFSTRDGRIRVWTLCKFEDSLHPDFNEDGTLKSWQS